MPVCRAVFAVLLSAAICAMSAGAWAGRCDLKRITELPMLDDRNPVVSINMNGQPRKVLMDTGGFWSLLNPALAADLKPYTSPVSGRLGLDGIAITKAVKMPTMQLGPATFENVEFLLAPPNYNTLDATLGAEWLKTFDLEIDPARKIVAIFTQDHCRGDVVYWPNSGVRTLRFDLDDSGHISLRVRLNDEKITADVDTGAPRTVLDIRAAERLFKLTPDSPGARPNATKTAFEYDFKSLDLGDVVLSNSTIMVAAIKNGDSKMILGMSDLARMHLYISYGERKIYATDPQNERIMQQVFQANTASLHNPNPSAVEHLNRAIQKINGKDFDAAAREIDSAIGVDPNDPFAFVTRSQLDRAKKDYDQALEDANRAVTLGPKSQFAYEARAEAYALKGDNDRAIQDMTTGLQLQPNNQIFYQKRGQYYANKGDFVNAVADIDILMKMQPGESVPISIRCKLEALMGRFDAARDICKAGLKLHDGDIWLLQSLAYVNLRAGRPDDAIDEYNEALKVFPGLMMALYGRGMAERLHGETAKGDADIATALAKYPDIAERFDK